MAAGRSRAAAPTRMSNESNINNNKSTEEAAAVSPAMATIPTTPRRRPTMRRRWTRRVIPHLVSLVLLLLHCRTTATARLPAADAGGVGSSLQQEETADHHHSSSASSLESSLPLAAAAPGEGGGDAPNATTSSKDQDQLSSGTNQDHHITCFPGESSSSSCAAASTSSCSDTAGTCRATTDGNDSNDDRLPAQQKQHFLKVPGVPTGADGLVEEEQHATQGGSSSVPDEPFWKPRPGDTVLPEGEDDEDDEYDEEEYDEYNGEEEYDEYNGEEEYDEEYEYDSADDEEYNEEYDEEYDEDEYEDDENDFVSSDRAEDLGVPQLVESSDVAAALESARAYVRDTVMVDPFYEPVRALCRNKDPSCALWATMGECHANPGYMNVSCAPVCHTCEKTHASTRCPVDPTAPDALYPGDLNRLFERVAADPALAHLQPKTLSRPDFVPGDGPATADYQLGLWLVQFDAFATPEECDRLVSFGMKMGYNRSADVGAEKEDGTFSESVNNGRTSTNAWCDEACYADPLVDAVARRMEHLTGIPIGNAEQLQLLQYEPGQFYQTHNDYVPYQLYRPPGVRILTLFIYLSDVDEGGETDFPRLGLKVAPKKGRAVLWPSVFDADPHHSDPRSDHGALPVIRGTKYGANAWYHQREVRNMTDPSCL